MAEFDKIKSYPKNEILCTEEEDGYLYNKNCFLTLDLTKKFLKELNFPDNLIDEYSLLFFNKKLYLKSNDYSKFFMMSYFTNEKEKKIKLDDSIRFISIEEFLELLSQSKFFEQFPIVLLKTSILIASIAEETPIKISDIQIIKNNIINLNDDPNLIFDEWQKNSGILSEEDNNILRILEYRNDINLKKVELKETIYSTNNFKTKKESNINNQPMYYYQDKNIKENNIINTLDENNIVENYNQKIFQDNIPVSDSQKKINNANISSKLEIKSKKKKYKSYVEDPNFKNVSDANNNQFKEKLQKEKSHQYKHFIAGALSGLISRVITAPLERLKILYQVNYAGKGLKPPNIFNGLKQVYLNEGLFGLFRGNLVNLIKCTPDSAIKLYVFEKSKVYFNKKEKENKFKILTFSPTLKLLVSGGLSGICATICVFPLDVIKTRISASSNSTYNGINDTAIKLYQEGGFRIFYRGIQASLSSAVPNCGLNLTAYETLKRLFSGSNCSDNAKLLTTPMLMLIGGLSAMFSSTILYPLQTIQSRIIMGTIFLKKPYQNMYFTDLIRENKKIGLIKLAKCTIKTEGFKGFYKGYCPGISKIILGNALGFSLYENIKNIIDLI